MGSSNVVAFFRHLLHGSSISRQYLENYGRIWHLNYLAEDRPSTSISDSADYLSIVAAANEDSEAFSRFRSNAAYLTILEHVTYAQGLSYLRVLSRNVPSGSLSIERVLEFNSIGSPLTFKYRGLGDSVSPTLLRYLKVAQDLKSLFGDIADLSVAEIGVGFGGQTVVNAATAGVKKVMLFDLPEVLQLADKFISSFELNIKTESLDGRLPASRTADLVISNYAFSELRREVQELYLDAVVSKCSRGYITWNQLSQNTLGGLTEAELMSRIPGSRMFDEVPLTGKGNSIIVWGHLVNSKPLS